MIRACRSLAIVLAAALSSLPSMLALSVQAAPIEVTSLSRLGLVLTHSPSQSGAWS